MQQVECLQCIPMRVITSQDQTRSSCSQCLQTRLRMVKRSGRDDSALAKADCEYSRPGVGRSRREAGPIKRLLPDNRGPEPEKQKDSTSQTTYSGSQSTRRVSNHIALREHGQDSLIARIRNISFYTIADGAVKFEGALSCYRSGTTQRHADTRRQNTD